MEINLIGGGIILAVTPLLAEPTSLIEKYGLPLGFVFIMILVAVYQENQRNKRERSAQEERKAQLEVLKTELDQKTKQIDAHNEWVRNKLDDK